MAEARGPGRRDQGAATAEFAVAAPAVVLVLAVAVAGIRVGVDEVRCTDAAVSAARLVARGEPWSRAREVAGRAAPTGATFTLGGDGETVRVTVTSPLPSTLASVGLRPPSATAQAAREAGP